VFFLQAEDGIRDRNVTGVQTCALPILPPAHTRPPAAARRVVEHLANNHRLEPFAAPDDDRALRLPGPESAGLTYHPEVGLLIDGHRCTPGRPALADLLTTSPGPSGPY